MHPDVRLEKLSSLPFSVQRFATAAASGSEPDMTKVAVRVISQPTLFSGFLPVVFANLDPTRIPSPERLDTSIPGPDITTPFIMAVHALEILVEVHTISPAVYAELWPRMWTWMQIIPTYRHFLPHPVTEHALGEQFLTLLLPLIRDEQTTDMIHSTLGGTPSQVRIRRIPLTEHGGENLEELVEGAGGSPHDLAQLIVRHIDLNANCSHGNLTTLDMMQVVSLSYIIVFIRVGLGQKARMHGPLLAAGLVRALTAALIPLNDSGRHMDGVEGALHRCLELLSDSVCVEPGYPRLPEALNAGLLPAIAILSQTDVRGRNMDWHLRDFLQSHIPGGMVYYPVVAALEGNIPPVNEIRDAERFGKSPIFRDWLALLDLACDRELIRREFHSPIYHSIKFCDNYKLKCGAIKKSIEIKRCSGCRLAHYCSAECQAFAWRHGGHREFCKDRWHSAPPNREHFPRRRDDAFMRLIVLRDYNRNKPDILRKQIQFIIAHRSTKFCTIFNYMAGACAISVVSLDDSTRNYFAAANSAWEAFPTGLHRVIINGAGSGSTDESEQSLALHYVLRSNSSIVSDSLVQLPAELPEAMDAEKAAALENQICLRVWKLSEKEMVETYG
ncbi:hypothetical protein B0H11DRAFT_2396604 [Mycena galericulata]|nr:hypothetical protein B0H11DRAFT_2396604 [Mycena galericulata]